MARFKPTRFMAEDSKYNKKAADYANIIKPQTENHEPSDRKNGRRVNY